MQYIWLIPLLPAMGAFINGVVGIRAFSKRVAGLVACAFMLGALFAFFVLLPPAMAFLVHFGEEVARPLIRIEDFISVVISLMFWIGVTFEMPLIVFILARIGVVTPERLAGFRRWGIVGAFVLGAVITPTFDPFNQTLVALPIIVLYEIGIVLARIAVKMRANAMR